MKTKSKKLNEQDNILLEIGVEDIPSIYLNESVIANFREIFVKRFLERQIIMADESISLFVTNRRIIFSVINVPAKSEDVVEEITGPGKENAFDENAQPTKALEGFLKSKGATLKDITEIQKGTRVCICLKKVVKGTATKVLLPGIFSNIISDIKLQFPKSMVWNQTNVSFVRPIRWILALYRGKVVDFKYAGVKASNITYGHRFYASNKPVKIDDASEFEKTLEKKFVIIDHKKRRNLIEQKLKEKINPAARVVVLPELVESLLFLSEWPVVFFGEFKSEYLDLPSEVLQESMCKNQKIFSTIDNSGKTAASFVGVINGGKENIEVVKKNYESILYARLSDAKFFYSEDTKNKLCEKVDKLKDIMFLKGLGTVYDRQNRLVQMAEHLRKSTNILNDSELELLKRSAYLCKADLSTHMVYEFPSLQGVMGQYYALKDNEPKAVCDAIREHYMPKGAGDDLPKTKEGSILAILDKLDIMVGCFALNILPSGNKDPYALRRSIKGIIQIAKEKKLFFDIYDLYKKNNELLLDKGLKDQSEFSRFFKDRSRLEFIADGYEYDKVDSVLATNSGVIMDVQNRLSMITTLDKNNRELFLRVCKIVERTGNISKSVGSKDLVGAIDKEFFENDLDKKLYSAIESNTSRIEGYINSGEYLTATKCYSEAFFDILHEFFDKVLVNSDNPSVRNNRLLMMKKINSLYTTRIADLSKIVILER